ncbi:conserved transmembrane transport MmpL7 domain protein [Mycobacterium ulcerans str. Harvey]|uniref:Conserved transmembrane transport MmpL7 domain protein n=1 Tax=Mycobacterium ulcerans str. Harvey TaxID=1299332 RepID=A0ABP3AJ68_MYCUL|nr:conserved transmembrane transport MmpL7 domain protein [Mycobacterium ulcerans str. Harvey]
MARSAHRRCDGSRVARGLPRRAGHFDGPLAIPGGREIPAAVPLVSFAILAACGLPYLLDRTATPISTEAPITSDAQPADTAALRNAGAPLAALTAVFGLGLVLVSAGSLGALSQIGTVVLFGVAALTVLARVCIPAAMQDRADRTTVATEPVAQPD